jgi:hypothetical protein
VDQNLPPLELQEDLKVFEYSKLSVAEALESHASRPALIQHITHQPPSLTMAQNIGARFVRGNIIVFFDDDVQSIDLSMSEFKKKSLNDFLNHAFSECKKHKSFIWGVYPVFNPFFRKGRSVMTTTQNYIVGAFYGIINRPKLKSIQLTLTKENGQKEDVERTIKYFIEDGIVLRFNKIGFVTKYYGKEGGLGTFEARLKPMLEASKLLKKEFPEYGDISTKSNGMTEFRLKKIPSKYEESVKTTNKTKKNSNTNKKTKRNKAY